jgi:nucleotide-binding universal stress UspA family protein
MRNIMVGVDGSPASSDALSWARGLAGTDDDATVVAVAVLPSGPPDARAPSGVGIHGFADWEVRVRAICSTGETTAAERLVFLEGETGPALLYAAVCHEADLVVVGTKGWGGHHGPRLGDDAAFLAHHVDVPFLAVPAGRRWLPPREVVIGVDGSEGSLAAVGYVAGLRACAATGVSAVYTCQPLNEWPV